MSSNIIHMHIRGEGISLLVNYDCIGEEYRDEKNGVIGVIQIDKEGNHRYEVFSKRDYAHQINLLFEYGFEIKRIYLDVNLRFSILAQSLQHEELKNFMSNLESKVLVK